MWAVGRAGGGRPIEAIKHARNKSSRMDQRALSQELAGGWGCILVRSSTTSYLALRQSRHLSGPLLPLV